MDGVVERASGLPVQIIALYENALFAQAHAVNVAIRQAFHL